MTRTFETALYKDIVTVIPAEREVDVDTLVRVFASAPFVIAPIDAYTVWKNYSASVGVDWAPLPQNNNTTINQLYHFYDHITYPEDSAFENDPMNMRATDETTKITHPEDVARIVDGFFSNQYVITPVDAYKAWLAYSAEKGVDWAPLPTYNRNVVERVANHFYVLRPLGQEDECKYSYVDDV
jgi:hypothetical protein